MYCEFFGFKEPPFAITPNPRFMFLSNNHQEAFAHLMYGIKSHAGFIELTGEVGTGKTTILRSLITQLNDDAHKTALVFNPRLSALELLRTVNREFGIMIEGSIDELTHSLNQFLLRENGEGKTVVLVIDEAQNLDPAVLEQIRMISNLETATDKLIQIVLAGQPELQQLLQQENLRQLSQRITVRFTLLPLDFNDMGMYISHRLEVAGGWRAVTFTSSALKKIYRHTRGLPRLVNLVCDRALLIAFTEETREITTGIASQAIRETVRKESIHPFFNRKLAFGILGALTLATGFLAGQQVTAKRTSPPSSLAPSPSGLQSLASAMSVDPKQRSEAQSAATAFNMLAYTLNLRPIAGISGKAVYQELVKEAAGRDITIMKFSGGVKQLLAADTPCILELKLPPLAGYRYLTLTGHDNGKLSFKPPVGGMEASLTPEELAACWTGRAYVPWHNSRKLPYTIATGTNSPDVRMLQTMLKQVGSYLGNPDGIAGRSTIDAIKSFQASRGLKADGKPGEQTLMLLYRSSGNSTIPGLAGQRKD